MLLRCCYRLREYGEVIHSVWDTEKLEVLGMPKDFLDLRSLKLPNSYSESNYRNCKTDFAAACEAILLSDNEFVVVLECCNIFYVCVTKHGVQYNKKAATTLPMGESYSDAPRCLDYINVGYRVTKVTQLRESAGIYRLVYNPSTNRFYTQDGVLEPTFDVSKLIRPSQSYDGYKSMVVMGAYAVVYFEDGYKFCYRDGNKLVLES